MKNDEKRPCPNPHCTAQVRIVNDAVETHRIHGRRAHACATDECPGSGVTRRQLWLVEREARTQSTNKRPR